MTNLAEIAVELRAAADDADIAETSFALELEAMAAGAARSRLEQVAARIGLSPQSTRDILDSYERRAKLLHAANVAIRALIPREAELRA